MTVEEIQMALIDGLVGRAAGVVTDDDALDALVMQLTRDETHGVAWALATVVASQLLDQDPDAGSVPVRFTDDDGHDLSVDEVDPEIATATEVVGYALVDCVDPALALMGACTPTMLGDVINVLAGFVAALARREAEGEEL